MNDTPALSIFISFFLNIISKQKNCNLSLPFPFPSYQFLASKRTVRVKVDYPTVGSTSINGNASSIAPISSQINGKKQGMAVLGVIQKVEMSSDAKGKDKTRLVTDPKGKGDKGEAFTAYYAPASVEVLDHVKVNVEPETPVSTLQSMLMSSKSSLSFSKEELRKVEEQMRRAFIEFYQKLRLLKSYCFLNQLALSKIMKKYDKVTLPDFFLADQLTSQVQAFWSLEFYVCYYGWEDFKRRSNSCHGSDCVRQLFEDRDKMQALNGLKYMSISVAVVMRTGNDHVGGMSWKILAGASSGVATIVATYWDIMKDWGLLRKNSRNPWLRDKLIISNNFVYFVAILSLHGCKSVLGFREAPFLHRRALIAIVVNWRSFGMVFGTFSGWRMST
ncbi:hypothetical protein LguiB_019670 [Lonicera macranthoides]